MKTPICDFVRSYVEKNSIRLHMPGHKGKNILGFEAFDITEIKGADSLYEADGIIKESEKNAGELFGAHTFYSTEGSSLAIRAMLYLACLNAKNNGERPLILAGRNAHKVFISSAALLDFDVEWIFTGCNDSYLSCSVTAEDIEDKISVSKVKPVAVYLTSPDYLGNQIDIKSVAEVCHKYGVLLLVDNAHGAYLKFLPQSKHPIDMGADICCDSAHKTLPVLTGGAYLHISKSAPVIFKERAKTALGLFGSTSPSYLILQSLDAVNAYLDSSYRSDLSEFVVKVSRLKEKLTIKGYKLVGNEELKITFAAKSYGYMGIELARLFEEKGLVCEFADPDFVVIMLTPQLEDSLDIVEKTLLSVEKRSPVTEKPPKVCIPHKAVNIRNACFADSESIKAEESCGRILASAAVGCPPAVSVVVSGEVISKEAVECFKYYGIEYCCVLKEEI